MRASTVCAVFLGLCAIANQAVAQERFADLVGPVTVQPVQPATQMEVPFITWGGDVATFLANGGLTTRPGTIFADQGLSLKLVNGDDFVGQVKNYLSGKTPLLRGTFRMLGQASEVLGKDPRTKPVVFLQLSWSKGDHIVARDHIKSLNDLAPEAGKKVKIACQQGGPHVGLLDDALRIMAHLDWKDVEIVWLPDLAGENGPAEKFRQDKTIDACCVITPDMIGLTGGRREVGSGAEGTVKGAHVVASTDTLLHSIADVYACRSDWYQANPEFAEKFVVGYLKGTEQLVRMRDGFEQSGKLSTQYKVVLQQAQDILGKEVVVDLTIDGHGLLMDCEYAGVFGNLKFFQEKGFQDGFAGKLNGALDLAVRQGYATARSPFDPVSLDYQTIAKSVGTVIKAPQAIEYGDLTTDPFSSVFEEGTLSSFTILFPANDPDFSAAQYGKDFDSAIRSASLASGAVIVIRGHSDPTQTLLNLIKAGMAKGIIRRSGGELYIKTAAGSSRLDLTQTKRIVDMIEAGEFEGVTPSPMATMQAALELSDRRAKEVKTQIIAYANQQGVTLNETQIQPLGVGILDPVVSKPITPEDRARNRRVEFSIVEVPAEVETEGNVTY